MSIDSPPRVTRQSAGLAGDIGTFVREVVAPNAAAAAGGAGLAPRQIVAAAGRAGLAGLLVPREFGGRGASHLEFAGFIEAVARVCASASVVLDVHLSVASEPLVLFGTRAQHRQYLPRLANGEWTGAFALTEPGSGSDASGLVTRADYEGDGWVLNGTKAFITNAGQAGLYLVLARTGVAGARGVSAFLVEADAPGVQAQALLYKLGLHGSHTAELVLDNVRVGRNALLGSEGEGFRVAMASLDSGRIGISAQAVGIAAGALDAAVDSAHAAPGEADRVALADCAARICAARALTHHAARTLDAQQPVTRAAAIAKLYSTDTCVAVAQAAMDMCSPASALDAHPAAVRMRDAKACQIYEGTNQVQRLVIARELLRG